jgi:Protein of unknown function (DUF1203)
MTLFRFIGIPTVVAATVRRTGHAPEYGHPVHREIATGYGPCRHCLQTFAVGQEDRLLFTYQPFTAPDALPAPGPVFIHAVDCPRFDATTVPDDFRTIPLVLESYGDEGRLLNQIRVGSRAVEDALTEALATPGTEYCHVRNGEAGCFMARVEPASESRSTDVGTNG